MTTENTDTPGEPEPPAAPGAPEPAERAEAAERPEAARPPVPDGPRRRSRRRGARVAGGVALLLAVVAGVTWTAVTVHGADRDPGAATWRLPKPSAGRPAGHGGTGLRAMLLPYGEDRYGRGPDMDGYGSDAELSGAQATALRKRSLAEVPRSRRRLLERQIDRSPVKGMAMRSYLSSARVGGEEATSGEVFALEIVLSRMDERTVRSMTAYQHEFAEAMKVFRKGPAVEGHEDTACFLPPTDKEERLDMMVCSGYVGDVLVVATATAVKPLDENGVVEMVAAQLDRIKDPGKAI
ncbi:hypothetical protein ACFY8B_30720 [Streptomyces sp. NPDC012751]|uniref:hypothetical protein n=1 Tax=Streptomyces sp. NPDC012751 TaxID=3364846 RepID=UPI003694353F